MMWTCNFRAKLVIKLQYIRKKTEYAYYYQNLCNFTYFLDYIEIAVNKQEK